MSGETPNPRRSARLQGLAADEMPTVDAPTGVPSPAPAPSYTVDHAGAYQYAIHVLLNRPPSPQRTLLAVLEYNGYKDNILGVLELSERDLPSLQFTDPDNGNMRTIVMADLAKIRLWFAFYKYCKHERQRLRTPADILAIGQDDFNTWREDYLDGLHSPSDSVSPAPSTPLLRTPPRDTSVPATGKVSITPTELFKRGIKRDPSLFPVMKQDSQFRQWKLHTVSLAKAQDCVEVVDPLYVPPTPEAASLFAQKQIYMYSVFCNTLLTNVGIKLVRDHEASNDAQAIFASFVKHYSASVLADLDQAKLMEYISSVRLGDNGQWKGSYHSFILHFQEQLRKLDDLQDPSARFSPGMRKILLQNAVKPIKELHSIQTTAEQLSTTTGQTQPYDTYLSLLLTAARRMDGTTPSTRARRATHMHEQFLDPQELQDELPSGDGEDSYDINSPVDLILANAHARLPKTNMGTNPAARLNDEVFYSLSSEAKQAWRTIPAEDKLKILGKTPMKQEDGKPSKPPYKPFTKPEARNINLHEVSVADYLAFHEHFIEKTTIGDNKPDAAPGPSSAMIPYKAVGKEIAPKKYNANAAETKANVSPADLRNVLKKETTDNSKHIIINGKPYVPADYSVNMHKITYRVSNHESCGASSPLVDRGSNGGVAGADVRVLYKHPHMRVNIEGIDRHQLVDIPLATVGGVVKTSIGPAIVVLPYFAHTGKGATIICPGQLEHYGQHVDDKSRNIGGTQSITTSNGVVIPMNIVNGLPRLPIRPFTDQELDDLPTIFLGDDSKPWDPTVLDNNLLDDDYWLNSHSEPVNHNPNFSLTGDYLRRTVMNHDGAWSFDPWGATNPDENGEDIIVFEEAEEPTFDEFEEPVFEEQLPIPPVDVPDLQSIQSDESSAFSEDSFHHDEYDLMLDDMVSYCDELKQHNRLVEMIQSLVDLNEKVKYENKFQTYSCTREPADTSYIYAVTTRAQKHATETADEAVKEPPTEAPPPEPPPNTHSAPHINPLTIGEVDLADLEDEVFDTVPKIVGRPRTIRPTDKQWKSLRPLFGWLDEDVIKKTFDRTTQLARMPQSERLQNHYKSPHPALNVLRRDEPLATDTVYSDVPAIFGGETTAQFYVGMTTQVCDAYGMKSEKQFVNTLEDIIRERGAPTKLVSDHAQVETSERVKDILRTIVIPDWQSEPRQPQQNPAERRYQTVVHLVNLLLDRTGAPPNLWLEALKYVCYLLNHTYNSSIDGIPLEKLNGRQVDISALLRFHWYQPVYYKNTSRKAYPSKSPELRGHIVGIAEHVGHDLTYRILTDDTLHIISRSALRPVDPTAPNKRADLLSGEEIQPPTQFLKTKCSLPNDTITETTNGEPVENTNQNGTNEPIFSPKDLVG